ncbi:tRNA (adenosine(37)-N6)-dimethylallyltransferase MiaA [Telmatospirillum sp.]|uniref:tRNA (adenosine(37)-N6)-dimethylallyltransferase MiaA n=1 Tax=Telmatospirillum sp. TaxID=2079197 RepID=UPI00284F2C5B|nr:tRNA (adenosine(37)-N6)-dimethylallyltransferase MiaA [Telmatospirillum sp.]MDR3437667.1 tRNA (adenosine(37)-N6)-dimethylallyltransferase MiaA [Telmatospirillum sp.]
MAWCPIRWTGADISTIAKAVIVAGPTASGKSALAMRIAQLFDGDVINADSMQVYDTLRVLTARPSVDDERLVPHRLYGILPPAEVCSAGRWRGLAAAACEAAWERGRLPVVVGGTGLYLRALTKGLSPVPDVPEAVRQEARDRFAQLGNAAFHHALAELDPLMAGRLHPGNSQRLVRAWEVMAATGRSLADWQAEPPADGLPARFFTIAVLPPRERLYAQCDGRFSAMISHGALDEVRALMAQNLAPELPAMRALGVAELAAHLSGRVSLEGAVTAGQQATRRYAKRQMTWFRHQIIPDQIMNTQFSESFEETIISNIRQFLLTTTE